MSAHKKSINFFLLSPHTSVSDFSVLIASKNWSVPKRGHKFMRARLLLFIALSEFCHYPVLRSITRFLRAPCDQSSPAKIAFGNSPKTFATTFRRKTECFLRSVVLPPSR
eukprot:Selendium_serpulae@DN6440_c2_g3_i2.p1